MLLNIWFNDCLYLENLLHWKPFDEYFRKTILPNTYISEKVLDVEDFSNSDNYWIKKNFLFFFWNIGYDSLFHCYKSNNLANNCENLRNGLYFSIWCRSRCMCPIHPHEKKNCGTLCYILLSIWHTSKITSIQKKIAWLYCCSKHYCNFANNNHENHLSIRILWSPSAMLCIIFSECEPRWLICFSARCIFSWKHSITNDDFTSLCPRLNPYIFILHATGISFMRPHTDDVYQEFPFFFQRIFSVVQLFRVL